MNTPKLNRALVLETPVKVADGAGGFTNSWDPLGVHWAALKPGTGREVAASATTISRVPYRITLRTSPHGAPSRPVAGQRFRDGSRIFHILAVADHSGQPQYLTCHAEEEVAS